MKTKTRKKGSIFTLLLKNYIIFTLVLFLVAISLFVVTLLRMNKKIVEILPEQLIKNNNSLTYRNYEDIEVERMLGANGYIAVLDEKCNVVYCSNPKQKISNFTPNDLSYISDYTKEANIKVRKFVNEKRQKQIGITKYTIMKGIEIVTEEYILDDDYNILYSSKGYEKAAFTPREYALFTDTLYKNYSLKKYPFIDQTGAPYTLLIYQSHNAEDILFQKFTHIVRDTILLFAICYLAMIGLFIFWLNSKVKRPLHLLYGALKGFSKGQRQQYVNYKGPQEFVNICDSFNDMSQELYDSEQKTKKLIQDKQKMLADISHDLKTPITIIKGYANAVNDGIVSNEDKPEYLATIAKKAESLNELVNVFYEYSKMEHPDYNLNLEPCDIYTFMRDFMANKYSEIYINGFKLEVDIPEDHVLCNIDKIQLKRAFENIVSNAIKHNKSGTTLFCFLHQYSGPVHITIADNGCGIPPEIGNDIFEPFSMGEKSRSKHGSGLGLAISKKIVDAHGGTIRLAKPTNSRFKTEFDIILPIIHDDSHKKQ